LKCSIRDRNNIKSNKRFRNCDAALTIPDVQKVQLKQERQHAQLNTCW